MSHRPTVLSLRAEALSLLESLRESAPVAIGGELVSRLRRIVEEVDRAIVRAERDSAKAYPDGAPREADVARRLGVDPATLRRHRERDRERDRERHRDRAKVDQEG